MGAVSSLIDAGTALAINGINNRQARRNAEWQRDVATQQWQMENEYNLPSNQMARLKSAGLNPNLAYQAPQGSASFNSVGAPAMLPLDPLSLSTARLQNSQAALNEQDTLSPEMQKVFKDVKIRKQWAEFYGIIHDNSNKRSQTILNQLEAYGRGYLEDTLEDIDSFGSDNFADSYAHYDTYHSLYGNSNLLDDLQALEKGEKPSYHYRQFLEDCNPVLNTISQSIYQRDFEQLDLDGKKHCIQFTIRSAQALAQQNEKQVSLLIEEINRLKVLNDSTSKVLDGVSNKSSGTLGFVQDLLDAWIRVMIMNGGYHMF